MRDQKAILDSAIEAFKRYKSGKVPPLKKKPKTEETASGETTKQAESYR